MSTYLQYRELIEDFVGSRVDDDLMEMILWEDTCFPFGSYDEVASQIQELSEAKSNGNAICRFCGDFYKSPSGVIAQVWHDHDCELTHRAFNEKY